jgi:DNA-binding NarL/FixJ family response regulator
MSGTSEKGAANNENGAVENSRPHDASRRRISVGPGVTAGGQAAASSERLRPPTRSPIGPAEVRARRSGLGAVVVDPLPLFRAGAVAALSSGGVPVLGEAAQLATGIALVNRARAQVLLVGGASVTEAAEAVAALPHCAVVVLMSQPTRDELVEMLGTGVAGFALRSLTPEELVATVEGAFAKSAMTGHGRAREPVFLPVLVGGGAAAPLDALGPGEPALTRKELEILDQLARGASNKRIAEALYVTPATVKTHLAHIYAKLGARGRHEALSQALAMGIVH